MYLPNEVLEEIQTLFGQEFAVNATEENLLFLITCLDREVSRGLSIEIILNANDLEQLKKMARKEQKKLELLRKLYKFL